MASPGQPSSQEAEVVDPRPSTGPDPYEVLRVPPTADAVEIAHAYRRRVREVHPDTADPAREPATDDGSVELGAIQDAYMVLRDPVRRAQYDQERAGRSARPTASSGIRVPVRVHIRPSPVQPPLLRAGPVRVEPVPRRSRTEHPSN